MTTYYDDRSVRVTSDAIHVDGHRYPLVDFTRIWHRRGDRSWRAVVGRGAIGAALLGPILAAGIGLAVAFQLDLGISGTVALVGVSCLLGLAAGPIADILLERMDRSYSRGTRQLELWALRHGTAVRLLHCDDALRFNQIYRAVQRAVENQPGGY